ncbi:MAG TPA: recombination protein O N-terminal domain-containing protein [Candidatus Paceibacterota bacterium]|nr:recombination protein O N-terminal domain-containing protein [Candidatus Paceibacterota bacterium]
MYTKHHTRALVLSAYDAGEADKVYALLTPDFGKVYAKARGVRLHGARHKGALQPLSEAHVSLVRGKSGWRITNVTSHRSLYSELASDQMRFSALLRVMKLVRRLVAGEGSAEKVFSVISGFSDGLIRTLRPPVAGGEGGDTTREDVSRAETLAVLRLFAVLGYLKHNERFMAFLDDIEDFSDDTLASFSSHNKEAVRALNESLEATQL